MNILGSFIGGAIASALDALPTSPASPFLDGKRNPNVGERTIFTLHSEIAKGGRLTDRFGRPHQHKRQTTRYARRIEA